MARSVWNIIVSGVTEQLSQVEQLNEKLLKVGRSEGGRGCVWSCGQDGGAPAGQNYVRKGSVVTYLQHYTKY
jgi:hypothetical protein